MKHVCLCAIMLTVVLGGCAGVPKTPPSLQVRPELIEAQTHFTYKGRPIPPFFLADFYGGPDVGDFWTKGMGKRISAVDVAGLFYDESDGSYSGCTVDRNEFVRFDLPNGDDSEQGRAGWFAYRFLGTTPTGVTVVEYVGNTGGSGTIPGVVFLRFEWQPSGYTQAGSNSRLVMRFLGEESWGDRVYRDIKLVGNELRLGPERSNLPDERDSLEPARTIILH